MSYELINGLPHIIKDPDASLSYGIDVAQTLSDGDSIQSVSAVKSGSITISTVQLTGTVIFVRVSGGTPGEVASCTFRWITVQDDTDERTIFFIIKQR